MDSMQFADGFGMIRTGTIHRDNVTVPGGGTVVLTVPAPGLYPGDVVILQPLTSIDALLEAVVLQQNELTIAVIKSGGGNLGVVDLVIAVLRGRLG